MKLIEIKENVAATTRQGIIHLQKMKDIEFIDFIQEIKNKFGGQIKDVGISLKVDGAGIRFGKDTNNKPFVETSRSGPINQPGSFSAFAKSKTDDPERLARAEQYDSMYDDIVKADFLKMLPADTKVVAEIFYNPMGEIKDNTIKFVKIQYDKSKLGSLMTFVPFEILVASSGEKHPQSDNIMASLFKRSNNEIKFIDPTLDVKGAIDINGLVDPIMTLDDEAKRILTSRKHADREQKAIIKQTIQKVKDQVADHILHNPNIIGRDMLGPDIEGLVLNRDGQHIKVTTPEFKQALAQDRMSRRK